MARSPASTRTAASTRGAAVHPLNPVAWFPFTEPTAANRLDRVNGLVAVPGSVSGVPAASGLTGFGATVNGTDANGILRVANNPLLAPGSGPASMAFWAFVTAITGNPVVWGKADGGTPTLQEEWFFVIVGASSRWQLSGSLTGAASFGAFINSSLVLNTWQLVIGTWDPVRKRTSIQVNNGAIAFSGIQSTGTLFAGAADMVFGTHLINNVPDPVSTVAGTICDALYFDRILNASERTWLYNGGAGRTNRNLTGAQNWRTGASARAAI